MKHFFLHIITFLALSLAAFAGGGGEDDRAAEPPVIDVEKLYPSEEGLILIEVAGISAQNFLARYSEDTLFIPFVQVCDFLRITNQVSPDLSTFGGEMGPDNPFSFSRRTNTAEFNGREFTFDPAGVRTVDGQIYIEHRLFLRVLGLTGTFDIDQLKLRIAADQTIPLVQWHRSLGRLGSVAKAEEQDLSGTPYLSGRSLLGGSILNWTISNSTHNGSITSTSGNLRVGTQLLYGALEAGGSFSTIGAEQNQVAGTLDHVRWEYTIPSSPLLRRVMLGTLTLAAGEAQGAAISNEPLAPRTAFGSQNLTGRTQPDWIVEMYDGNRLVDITRADSNGRYSFSMPVGYGTTDRTLRQIGPNGEIIIEERRLQLGTGMLPVGEVEYALAYGVERLDTASPALGEAHLGFGLFDFLTVGADARYTSTVPFEWRREGLGTSVYANAWMGGSSSFGLGYDLDNRLVNSGFDYLAADNTVLRLGVDSLAVEDGMFSSSAFVNVPFGAVSLGSEARFNRSDTLNTVEVAPQLSGYMAGITYESRFRYGRTFDPNTGDAFGQDIMVGSLRVLTTPISGMLLTLRGDYDFTARNLAMLDVSSFYRLNEYLGLSLKYSVPNLDWSRGVIGAQLNLDFHSLRLMMNSGYNSGSVSTNAYAQGGIVVSGNGVEAYRDLSIGHAVLIVHPYQDINGNGERDDDEPYLEPMPARLAIGNSQMYAANGVFSSITANRECVLEIDRWYFADRDLFPGRSRYGITTAACGVTLVDVPFSKGFDVGGTSKVEGLNDDAGYYPMLTGLRIQLVSEKNGSVYEGEMFSDGTLFFAGVAAGEYHLRFDEQQLQSRYLHVTDLPETLEITEKENTLPVLTFRYGGVD